MKVPYASVYFTSDAGLHEVGSILSKTLLGNCPFVAMKPDMDSVPWIRLQGTVLGCNVEVGGFPSEKGYLFRIVSDGSGLDQFSDDELQEYRTHVQNKILVESGRTDVTYDASIADKFETVDLREYVEMLLGRIDGFEIVSRSNW